MSVDTLARRVVVKCDALQRAGLWPEVSRVRPRPWLNNFKGDTELALASALLDRFVLFSDRSVNALLRGAFRNLIEASRPLTFNKSQNERATQTLTSALFFTRLEGERPNPTDSGNLFCRKVRQELGIPEERIVEPSEALDLAIAGCPIVLLDDFLGSGQQLIKTWKREYRKTAPHSFEEAHTLKPVAVSYLCLMATTQGLRTVSSIPAKVFFCHEATSEHSITKITAAPGLPPGSDVQTELNNFLRQHASHLILKPYMKQDRFDTLGFYNLGLTMAFEHSVPDASIPILWARSTRSDWSPLMERI